MAIKVNNTTTIADDKKFYLNSITFADATYQNTKPTAGFPTGLSKTATGGSLLQTIANPNAYSTSASDYFGYIVDVSGNYAIVGAYLEDDAAGADSGAAYIFDVTTGRLVWTLTNPNAFGTSASDYFGYNVAISGNYAIVGASSEDDAGGADSGKAYIYNVTTGALVWTLSNPNAYSTMISDGFGRGVAISGNYAIVGAYLEDDESGADSGKAYIFDVTTGQLVWTLTNPNAYSTSAGDYFGFAVDISGNYAIVGAYLEDDAGGSASGKAYIFDVTTGALVWTLTNPNAYSTGASDVFGRSLAISGNYAIVGAYLEDDAGGADSGKAYIFNVTTGQLVWTLNNPDAYASAGDQFSWIVDISGNYAIVGAYLEDDAGGADSGKAYIFNVTTGQLVRTLDNPNAYSTSAGDRFGGSVAISGNYAIVGAWGEDDAGGSGSGKVYTFAVNDVLSLSQVTNLSGLDSVFDQAGDWSSYNVSTKLINSIANPNAYSTVADDLFGHSVSISGNYAIAGAYFEDEASGAGSGKAYIFNVTTGALVWTLNNPNGYSTVADDYFGMNVAISGNYAMVGAAFEDDAGGSSSGKVYIFNVTTGSLLYTLNNPNAFSTSADDYFGYSQIAISGSYAIIGTYTEDDAGGADSGKAYIYNVTTGTLVRTLSNPNAYSTSLDDRFGAIVDISGNYAIIGAYNEDDPNGEAAGKAYIFDVTTGQLLWTLNDPNVYGTGDGDYFGSSVSISGNYAIVGAYGEGDERGATSGKVYIYNVTNGQLLHTLSNPNAYSTSAFDYFGGAVSISGRYAVVFANGESNYSGVGYIYDITTGQLIDTITNPSVYSTGDGDNFGTGLDMSDDAIIVGAPYESAAGGTASGAAYIFKLPYQYYNSLEEKIISIFN